MSHILRHLYLWVLMLLPQLSWGQFIWHEDMGSPSVTGRVTLSYDTTSYVFDTVNAEEHSGAGEVWDDLNSQFESAGITWAEIYELGKEESESYTVRLRMEVNTGYSNRYLNFGHNGAELVICQQGMPLPDPDPEPEPDPEPDPEPEPEPEPSSPYDTTLNWILTKTYNSDGSSCEDIVYYDGLGYARQSVMINGRGTGDIVKMHSFDAFGRETRDWLPYSKAGGGGFDASAQASQQAFYKGVYPSIASQDDIRGYTETVYESGSSGRALRQHIQGQEYADTSRSVRTHYRGNGPTDVPILDYVESTGEFVLTGHYAQNTLTGVETVLPSGERQRVWSDLDGRTVMQESCGPDGWVKSLFCYDIRGLLRAVVTPEGVKRLTEGTEYNWSSPLLQDYSYVYAYDGQGRMSSRRLPSCSEEYFVYDRGGNVVMRQNGLLREQNQWIGVFYDPLGRVTSERLLAGSGTQDQSLVRSYQDLFDEGQSPSVYSPTGGTLLLENTYDTYPTNLSSSESFSADGLDISYDARTKSLLTVQRIARITENGVSSDMCRRVFYYDSYGNVLQTVEKDGLRTLRHTSVRDLQGNVLTDRQTVTRSNVTDTWQTDCTYDPRGRVLRTVGTLNGQQVSDVSYGYDSVGELVSKSFHHDGGHFHEQVSRNLQQWTVEKRSPVFILSLDYHTSALPGSVPQYGGRISAQRWEHREADDATVSTGGYSYSYDSLGRLTGAGYHDWGSAGWSQPSDNWTEKGLTYTDNGDILTLKRYGAPGSRMHDDLSFTYTGARRNGLQYDANGNLKQDAVRGFTMSYNFLNLPSKIWVSEDDYMSYTWYYDGTKVSVEGYEGSYGADYIGSFVYSNDDDGLIRDIRFGDGIVRETSNGVYETLYWVTDHLGSPRVAFTLDDSEYGVYVAERNDYYPFGGRWDDGSGQGGTIAAGNNRYALSGKERQTMSRMGSYLAAHESLLDFGARFYDPATAIFLQQDPLAEKYYNLSPYAYCANNPVNFVDPDGRFFGDPVRNPEIRRNLASNLYGKEIRSGGRNHQGFDYYAPVGTDVLSVKDGRVIGIAYGHESYGTSVTIEHRDAEGNVIYSFYAHLDSVDVTEGTSVEEGQVIAKSGTTGNAKTSSEIDEHLHFELRTQKENIKGLTGKKNPNEIVDTKFISQDPDAKPQNKTGVIKISKDGSVEIKDIIY